ncbi:MAG: MarC family protein [Candidatus Margulisbacteria bacterium]|jgi:multiple antibiotic resistance protein|nr:MarC family protein [Candidatus Margulisiibacteriota bacterium]
MEAFFYPFLKSVIALFIITDSPGNLPFFLGLTEGESRESRRQIFSTAILTGLILMLVFLFAGLAVLDLFNVTLNDFKIAGGILLLWIAIEIMLRGRLNLERKEDAGVVPLGCPLLVGPGAITTSIVLLQQYGYAVVLSAIAVTFLLIWLVLYFAETIHRVLGHNGSILLTKVAAILIAAIAVQFVRQGIMAIILLK